VENPGVEFLDAGGGGAGDDDFMVGHALGFPSVFAQEGDGGGAAGFGGAEGAEAIFGVATGGEGDEDITGAGKGLDLAGEDLVVGPVIGDAGHGGGIGSEGDGRECAAGVFVFAGEFLGEVGGVGGAAAIAAGEELAAGAEAGGDGREDGGDLGEDGLATDGEFLQFAELPGKMFHAHGVSSPRARFVMKLMDRYLLGLLLGSFGFCLLAFYFLFILADLFDSLGDVIKNKAGWWVLVQYYSIPAPYIFQLIVPAAFFLSVIYVLVTWSSSRELVALQAGGVSLHRVAVPVFLAGLGVMALQYGLFFHLSPQAGQRRQAMEDQIEKRTGRGERFPAVVYKNPTTGALWFAQEIDLKERTLKQAEIVLMDDLGRDRMKIFAARGRYTEEGFWDFAGVRRVDFSRDGTAAVPQDLAQMDAPFLNESPEQLVAVLRPASEMSWPELSAFIHAPYQPAPSRMAPYRTEHLHRMAYPWLVPVLVLFAFALAVTHDRRSMAGTVFRCILVLAGLLVWMQLSLALGNGKRIPPWLAAWSPVLIFGAAGLWLFAERTGWLWNLRHYIGQGRAGA